MLFLKIKLIPVFIILLAVLSGCYFEEISETPIWEADAFEHWQNGENGEKLNIGEHEPGGDYICTVCKSKVFNWGDRITVTSFDEYQSPIRATVYGTDGTVLSERTYEYGYGKDGYYTYSKTFENGKLVLEYEYAVTEDGFGYPKKETAYYEDCVFVNEYDENTTPAKFTEYNLAGEIISETEFEYSEDSSGNLYCSKETVINYSDSTKTVAEYHENSGLYRKETFSLEGDAPTLISVENHEYEYDGLGRPVYYKETINGEISCEDFIAYSDENSYDGYYDKKIIYNEDRSYTVFDYDESGNLFSETEYSVSENGTVFLSEETSYNGDGSTSVIKRDESGEITFESYKEIFTTEEGALYLGKVTEFYHFTGIKQVHEYNVFGDMISSKSYNFGDELLSTYDYVYEYGENNLVVYKKELFNGKLSGEFFYEVVPTTEESNFENRLVKTISYEEDGSKFVWEYDENEILIKETHYDAKGNIIG